MKDLLIKDVTVVTMDAKDRIVNDGVIVVNGGKIEFVGTFDDVPGSFGTETYRSIISASGCVAIPGLVNTHTHSPMCLMRGYADDLPLQEWLEQKIFPVEAKLSPEDTYWAAMLSCIEMIKSGTTTFADMYFSMDDVARAVEEVRMRACLSVGITSDGTDYQSKLRDVASFCERWNNQAGGRITTMFGPHAPYTCSPELLKDVSVLAHEMELGIHIHVSETYKEVEDIRAKYGLSPVEFLNSCGVFDGRTLAAHCVALSDEDIAILAEKRVAVSHNPGSNMKLASGVAPVGKLMASGVTVGLGTDGSSSNNNLDMFEEMRLASLLHKVANLDAVAVPAYTSLKMATIEGAKCLGLDYNIGSIETGKRADIAIVDFNQPHLVPRTDILSHLVYSAGGADVITVVVDGKVVMENRKIMTVDEEEVMEEVNFRAKKLLSSSSVD